jgi:hypothetical protein
VAIGGHFLEFVFPQLLARLDLDLGSDGLVSRDTGWSLRCDGLLSGPSPGRYRYAAGAIYGPCAHGQYALRDDGRLFENSSDTGFYLVRGHLFGECRRLR